MNAAESRVLLTGATGGIGKEMADALLAAGAAVLLVGRSPGRLGLLMRSLIERHRIPPARVEWHACDLSDQASLADLARVAAKWRCNTVVHNAGLPAFGRLEAVPADKIGEVMQLNLLAPMLLTQALLPHLQHQPAASIVFVGSALGRIGLPGFSVYSASKFGLRGFAESLRRELGDGPVRVQYLGPRSTRTAFNGDEVERFNELTQTAMDPPGVVADALLRLLETDSAERFIGFPEKLAVRINGALPGLLDASFAKHRRALPMAAAPVASHNPIPEGDSP